MNLVSIEYGLDHKDNQWFQYSVLMSQIEDEYRIYIDFDEEEINRFLTDLQENVDGIRKCMNPNSLTPNLYDDPCIRGKFFEVHYGKNLDGGFFRFHHYDRRVWYDLTESDVYQWCEQVLEKIDGGWKNSDEIRMESE